MAPFMALKASFEIFWPLLKASIEIFWPLRPALKY